MDTETEVMDKLRGLKGLIASINITSTLKPQMSVAMSNMRSWNDTHGFTNVEYKIIPATLVEAGRDSAAQHALKEGYDWLLQIDGDAAPFPEDALARMLHTLYVTHPQLDALGAYVQLKGRGSIPAIDTGTGTWEEHYPGEGILPVIRTGAHFFCCKTQAFQRFGPPWFRTRQVPSPAQAFAEVDSFARQRTDGRNPLWDHPEWLTLLQEARRVSPGNSHVGEDSGFFDALHAAGGQAAVDTDLVVGHVADDVILPDAYIDHMKEQRRFKRLAIGVGA